MKLKIIRGERILEQIAFKEAQLDESTFKQLERNTQAFLPITKQRQHAMGPVHIVKLELVPARDSQTLIAKAQINSSGTQYDSTIQFDGVIYEDGDQNDNVSFVGVDGEEYNIIPIDLMKSNVKVVCSCLDFYWRFAATNATDGSLLGKPPPLYQKRTQTRPPANIRKVPGVCKHLLKMAVELKVQRVVR
jgi:hypothetical protein